MDNKKEKNPIFEDMMGIHHEIVKMSKGMTCLDFSDTGR